MPNMILLPDGTGTSSVQWAVAGEGTRHECLDDNNGDTSYVACSAPGRTMIIEYADPSVAEADIASIDSVRFRSSGRSTNRLAPSIVTIGFQVPSGNASEVCFYDSSPSSYETITGVSRSYSDGSSAAWTYANLVDLEMICTKTLSTEVRLSYLILDVAYTAVSADNATFFGANF